jgi:hypothetical protein
LLKRPAAARPGSAAASNLSSAVTQAFRTPGHPLPHQVLPGFDFARVRIHDDPAADLAARHLHASAWTAGRDIFFAAGRYAPATTEGARLLAHELAHVVQQGGNAARPECLDIGRADDAHEHAADRVADEAVRVRQGQPVVSSMHMRGTGAPDTVGTIQRGGVSYELGEPPDVSAEVLAQGHPQAELPAFQALSPEQRQVMGWLYKYRDAILLQELLTGVDRRAIAGAIAWEALENVQSSLSPSRAAGGPGKVHAWTTYSGNDDRPAAPEEVEVRGLMPGQTLDQRVALLKTPEGAIAYIAAIMQAMAEDARASGFDIWRNPEVLTWGYQSKYVDTFAQRMREKAAAGETTFDTSASTMAVWVRQNMPYLELAVGAPLARNQQAPPGPSRVLPLRPSGAMPLP